MTSDIQFYTETDKATGQKLYVTVRAGLIARGSSLNQWCEAHGYHHSNVRKALLGEWDGPTAKLLRLQLLKDVLGDCDG